MSKSIVQQIAALPAGPPATNDMVPPASPESPDAGGQDVTTRIRYDVASRDWACYATVDNIEKIIGYAANHSAAIGICRDYRYDFYSDRHTPERAAAIAMEREPAAIYADPAPSCACLDPSICWCGAYPMDATAKEIYSDLDRQYVILSAAIDPDLLLARPAELAEFIPGVIADCPDCGMEIDAVVLCSACNRNASDPIADALAADPNLATSASSGPDAPVAAPTAASLGCPICDAPIAYLVREGETIYQLCADCYRLAFQENEYSPAAWELLYCSAYGCDKPATMPGLVEGMWMCVACAVAGEARMHRAIFWTGPRCTECGEPLDAPGLCGECQAIPPLTRAPQHDLPLPADAWHCGVCHQIFWTDTAHAPLVCPRCEHQTANPPLPLDAACPACGGAHNLAHCEEFAAEWRRQELEDRRAGEAIAAHIQRNFADFLKGYAALTEEQRSGVVRLYQAAQRAAFAPEQRGVADRWNLLAGLQAERGNETAAA